MRGAGQRAEAPLLPGRSHCARTEARSGQSVETLDPNDLYDFFYQSLREPVLKIGPSQAINTLGEVPDSDWFTNRHSLGHRLSLEALKRGPGDSSAPQPPFLVVGAKTDGITPGFRMTDAKGRLYFVKPDPRTNRKWPPPPTSWGPLLLRPGLQHTRELHRQHQGRGTQHQPQGQGHRRQW